MNENTYGMLISTEPQFYVNKSKSSKRQRHSSGLKRFKSPKIESMSFIM